MDFKVRCLDFVSIYVKQMHAASKAPPADTQLALIQGLLKALTAAHGDKHTILFDRVKSVLASLAKQASSPEESKTQEKGGKECKILMTEMMSMLLKQHKDASLSKAYSDSFIVLTKHFWEDSTQREFLVFTYKELLKKFLGGRTANNSGLNQKFFEKVVEACPSLGWALCKPLLRCFLSKDAKEDGDARGNHQRLQAIEIFGALIRSSSNAQAQMAEHLSLMTSVIVRVVQTSESW